MHIWWEMSGEKKIVDHRLINKDILLLVINIVWGEDNEIRKMALKIFNMPSKNPSF